MILAKIIIKMKAIFITEILGIKTEMLTGAI